MPLIDLNKQDASGERENIYTVAKQQLLKGNPNADRVMQYVQAAKQAANAQGLNTYDAFMGILAGQLVDAKPADAALIKDAIYVINYAKDVSFATEPRILMPDDYRGSRGPGALKIAEDNWEKQRKKARSPVAALIEDTVPKELQAQVQTELQTHYLNRQPKINVASAITHFLGQPQSVEDTDHPRNDREGFNHAMKPTVAAYCAGILTQLEKAGKAEPSAATQPNGVQPAPTPVVEAPEVVSLPAGHVDIAAGTSFESAWGITAAAIKNIDDTTAKSSTGETASTMANRILRADDVKIETAIKTPAGFEAARKKLEDEVKTPTVRVGDEATRKAYELALGELCFTRELELRRAAGEKSIPAFKDTQDMSDYLMDTGPNSRVMTAIRAMESGKKADTAQIARETADLPLDEATAARLIERNKQINESIDAGNLPEQVLGNKPVRGGVQRALQGMGYSTGVLNNKLYKQDPNAPLDCSNGTYTQQAFKDFVHDHGSEFEPKLDENSSQADIETRILEKAAAGDKAELTPQQQTANTEIAEITTLLGKEGESGFLKENGIEDSERADLETASGELMAAIKALPADQQAQLKESAGTLFTQLTTTGALKEDDAKFGGVLADLKKVSTGVAIA